MSSVLSIALLFSTSAHAQSNWWEQAKRNHPSPPAAVEQAVPPSLPVAITAPEEERGVTVLAAGQEIDTSHAPEQNNTASDIKQAPGFSYLEIGRSTIEIETTNQFSSAGRYINVNFDGLFGSYQKPATDFAITELGIVSTYRRQPRLQLTGALTWQRWEVDTIDRRLMKLMIGLQAQFSQHFDMWVSTGYMWTRKHNGLVSNDKGKITEASFFNTQLGKIGMQFFLTPEIGIIFEADFLNDMVFDFYRIGIRFNF